MKQYDLKYPITHTYFNIIRFFEYVFQSNENIISRIDQYAGRSTNFGKTEIINRICNEFPEKNIRILDVGPGRGIYNQLLKSKGYTHIDAVEVYKPYIDKFNLNKIYNNVFNEDIVKFRYDYYDLIIFGDVLEHLKVADAKRVLKYARERSKLIAVAVPYNNYQIGQQLDGSGDHRQFDLTREVFMERFEGFKLLLDNESFGVFYWKTNRRANKNDS